jgi:hypothetical protein
MVRSGSASARLLQVASLAFVVIPGSAQAQRKAPPVVAGLDLHLGPLAGQDTVVFKRVLTRSGQDSSAGTRAVVLRVVDGSGPAPLLEVGQRFPGGGGEIVDTALADLGTLGAVAHRSHQPARTMRFRFTPAEAEGTVAVHGSAGDSVTQVHQALGGPIFDSNVIDLVVGALPLRQGFTAELPFFIYERGGRVPVRVAVRERATVPFAQLGPREVWVVTVAVPGAPATMWVDTHSHAVLRVRYDIQDANLSFTDERVTPLRG